MSPWVILIGIVALGVILVWWRRKKMRKEEPEWESAFPL